MNHDGFPPPTVESGPASSTRRSRLLVIASVGVVVLLGLSGLIAVSRDNDRPNDGRNYWPQNPTKKVSLTATWMPAYGWSREPIVKGWADNFYVLEPGDNTARFTRYVNGEQSWSVKTRRGIPLKVYPNRNGDPLVLTGDSRREDLHTFARIDRGTGERVWSIEFLAGEVPEFTNAGIRVWGRTEDDKWAVTEYDYDTGRAGSRVEGDLAVWQDTRFAIVDSGRASAQRYDLTFEPVGEPIDLDRVGSADGWLFSSSDQALLEPDDWVYFADGAIIVQSANGDRLARCTVPFDYLNSLQPVGDGLLFVEDGETAAVLQFSDGACTTRWERDDYEAAVVSGNSVHFTTFVGLSDQLHTDLVDPATGEPMASVDGQAWTDGHGLLFTNTDGKSTVTEAASGAVLWSLDIPEDASVRFSNSMIIVMRANDERQQVDLEVYAD